MKITDDSCFLVNGNCKIDFVNGICIYRRYAIFLDHFQCEHGHYFYKYAEKCIQWYWTGDRLL